MDVNAFIVAGCLICCASGFIGSACAKSGNGFPGFLLGLCLGPMGWIIAALLTRPIADEAKHQVRLEAELRRLRGG